MSWYDDYATAMNYMSLPPLPQNIAFSAGALAQAIQYLQNAVTRFGSSSVSVGTLAARGLIADAVLSEALVLIAGVGAGVYIAGNIGAAFYATNKAWWSNSDELVSFASEMGISDDGSGWLIGALQSQQPPAA
jgi:predicted acyltransferase